MPLLAKNSKALHDYTILEKFEAGIVLTGAEVKSAKGGSINLKGSFVDIRGDQAVLKNMHIALYKAAGKDDDYNPTHDRQLLLKAREIKRLLGKREAERLTIVPLSVYTTRNLVKVELAIARGKKQYEKRDVIKKRDLDREVRDEA